MLKRFLRVIIFVCLQSFPGRLRRKLFEVALGWQIHESCRLGLSWMDVERLVLEKNTRIGHFNVFRHIYELKVGESSSFGQWNWVTAADVFFTVEHKDNRGRLAIGRHTGISSRHYVDCSGGIEIGSFTTIAGLRQTILTHQIDAQTNRQTVKAVKIGSYCLISSNTCIAPGAVIPDKSLIAMGAVIVGTLNEEGMLWAGVPARAIRRTGGGCYFSREVGFVSTGVVAGFM